jgi:ADP-ribose pyrophosphatase YjhB (NUDIX family)
MSTTQKFTIRSRGIIVHEGKMLVVRHAHDESFTALPGGHLEWGEDIRECMKREIIEELGVEPVIGRLLYINTFQVSKSQGEVQPFEFFFEITNGRDYIECENRVRTHAHELAEILWTSPTDEVNLLPREVYADFKNGVLGTEAPRYINGIKS